MSSARCGSALIFHNSSHFRSNKTDIPFKQPLQLSHYTCVYYTVYPVSQKNTFSLKLLTKVVHIYKPMNHSTSEGEAIWLRSKPPLD